MTATTQPVEDSGFSAPFLKTELYALPQYIAGPLFEGAGKWKSNVYVLNSDGVETPLDMKIVGRISNDRPHLGPHGNLYAKSETMVEDMDRAKQQFTLERPNQVDFSPDWTVAHGKIKGVQKEGGKSDKHNHFTIAKEDLRFNFYYCRKLKINDKLDDNVLEISKNYKVAREYRDAFEAAKTMNRYIERMPVYDTKGDIVEDPDMFEDRLVGSLVEVTFNLHVMPVKESDTFTTRVVEIAILVNPPPPPPKSFSPKKPRREPQTPSRGEKIGAANAFVTYPEGIPRPDFGVKASTSEKGKQKQRSSTASDNEEGASASPAKKARR